MSAGLNSFNDMVYTGETPWHQMGTYMDNISIQDLIDNKNLNFPVEKRQLLDANGNLWHNKYVLTRTDTGQHLSDTAVTQDYEILQNEDAFKFFDPFLKAGHATIETAGVIRGGEKVWALANMHNHSYEPIPGDEHKTYLLLLTGHDHKTSLSVLDTMVRVVCQNTVHAAMSEGSHRAVKVHHKRGIREALDLIGEVTLKSKQKFQSLEKVFKKMAFLPIDPESCERYFRQVLNLPFRDPKQLIEDEEKLARLEAQIASSARTVNKVMKAYEEERETLPFFANDSYYHAYQAITRYLTWMRNSSRPEKQFEYNILGEAQQARSKAVFLAKERMAEVA